MNKLKDLILALEARVPQNAVPIWEVEFQCWDLASGRHVYLGREFMNLSPEQKRRALYTNAEIFVEVARKLSFSAFTVPNERWDLAPGVPAYYWLPTEARYRQVEIIREMADADMMLIGISGGVYGMPPSDIFVEFSLKLYDAPEEIDQIAKDTFENGLEQAKKLRDAGVGAVVTATDLADNLGPFYNRDHMNRFILPYLVDWATQVKKMGHYAILHTDGNISKYLEDIAGSGIHALQAIDPLAGMNIQAVQDQVGDRLCLCGNVDGALLLNGPQDQIYDYRPKGWGETSLTSLNSIITFPSIFSLPFQYFSH